MKTKFAVVKAALATALVVGASSSAKADLTYQGAVGLPINPTAQIPLPGGVRVQGSYYDLGDTASGANRADAKFYGIHAAGRAGGTFEVNGGVHQFRSNVTTVGGTVGDRSTGFSLGGKYLFSRETDPEGVRLAVGAGFQDQDVFGLDGKNYHAYLTASKYLGAVSGERVPVTGHLGLRYDRYEFQLGAGPNTRSNKASVFAGVEVPFTRTGDLSFVGELGTKTVAGGSTQYSASVRYRPQEQPFSASLGIQRLSIADSGLFAQIGYSFDTSGAAG
jgi:hypothetical protein